MTVEGRSTVASMYNAEDDDDEGPLAELPEIASLDWAQLDNSNHGE